MTHSDTPVDPRAEAVLDEWVGDLDENGCASPEKMQRWWTKDPELDRTLAERYGPLVEQALAGELEHWRAHPRSAVALLVLLDQWTRNIYRDTPRMYAGDGRALSVARELVDSGVHETLPAQHRMLAYMPFMHAEEKEAQDRCVALFEELAAENEALAQNHEFAVKHRDIVARFGRFPHRNAILGRPCTEEEEAFLEQPGSGF